MKTQIIKLILLTLLFSSCNIDKKNSKVHFGKSEDFYKSNDWYNASKEIDIAIKLDSTNLESFYLKSKILNKSNLYVDAIQTLKFILNKNFKPDTINYSIAGSYFSLATYYHTQEYDAFKKQEALANSLLYIENSIKMNMNYFEAYNLKQKILFNMGRYNEAIITLNNALNIYPGNMSLLFSRGVVKEKLGDISGSIIDLNVAIISNKLDSDDLSTAYRSRGIIYSDIDSLQNAIADCTKSIEFDPKSELAYLIRGGCFRKLGQMDKACEDYRKSADLGYIPAYDLIKLYCE